jgi:hypothetical protein
LNLFVWHIPASWKQMTCQHIWNFTIKYYVLPYCLRNSEPDKEYDSFLLRLYILYIQYA